MANGEHRTKTPLWQYAVAAAAGITSATAAAIATIRREFFKNVKDIPEVAAHLLLYENKLKDHETSVLQKAGTPEAIGRETSFGIIQDLKQANRQGFADIMEKMHYRSALKDKGAISNMWRELGLGTIDRARQMSSHSRNQVIINAGIMTVIGTAASWTFISNHHMRQNIKALHERLDEKERQRA